MTRLDAALVSAAERILGAPCLVAAAEAASDGALAITASDRAWAGRLDAQTREVVVLAARPDGAGGGSLLDEPWAQEPRYGRMAETGPEDDSWTLSVPAFSGDAVAGRLAVARRTRRYSRREGEALLRLAGYYGRALERLSFEERLSEAGVQNDTLFDSHPDGVAIISEKRFVRVSPAFAALLGRPAEEVLGRVPTEFVVAEEHAAVRTRMATAQGGTHERPSEYTIVRPDGSMISAEAITRVIRWERRPAFLIVFRDITARKEAEEALRYRTRFESLVSEVSARFLDLEPGRIQEGIVAALEAVGCLVDADRVYASFYSSDPRMVLQLHEWRRSEGLASVKVWEGTNVDDLAWFAEMLARGRPFALTPEDLPPPGSPEREVIEAADVRSMLLAPIVSRGATVGLLGMDTIGRERTWPDDAENLLKIIGELLVSAQDRERVQEDVRVARDELEKRVHDRTADLERAKRELEQDIEARERAEAETVQLERQLRQGRVFEAVGQLAGGVAHDFNNILGSVIGCLYGARLRAAGNPAVLEELDRAQALCKRGGELTRQLLTVARRQPGRPTPVRLEELLAELRLLLERTLPKDIALAVDLQEGLPPIRADRSMLTTALLNLCLNARDAMARGGILRIAAAREPEADGSGWVSVSVTDTGVGIPEALQDRIFDPFFTTKEPGAGSGLGLAMVEATAREHGGTVSFRSRPGDGSTFTLRLPAAVSRRPMGRANGARGGHPSPDDPILVVEDEDEVARLVCGVLEAQGYATLRAATGLEALERVRDCGGALALVILDLVLPELGGEEVHRLLRAVAPEVPVLLTTGREDLARTHLAGVPLLAKPFTPTELLDKVVEYLGSGPSAA